jgi:hypothetical protein
MRKQTSKDKQIEAENIKRDFALYYVEGGEPGFSPARNKAVIENTIRKTNLTRAKKIKAYREKIQERADAVATYLKSRVAEGGTPVEKYFGKRWMAYLRGQQIMSVLKQNYAPKNKKVYPGARKIYLPE